MHLLRTNFNGNPNIGLIGIATDEYCIIGSRLSGHLIDEIKKALKVPVIHTTICGTELAGVFCAANPNCLLLPNIVFDSELKVLKKHKIKYRIIDTKHTALGNNILCNDKGCVLSREFEKDAVEKIENALKVKAVKSTISELDIIGSTAILNDKGCLVHEDIRADEKKLIEKTLNIKTGTGTINMGSPFVKAGLIVNSNGFIASKSSGGPEIANADEVLGFI
ncbi:translation initiation factor IF-6 [Candidatus Woesearchaeota archaeon]|nr:translation initiation factor IF-6 [Candidatus Woesearchaeota archaeon]